MLFLQQPCNVTSLLPSSPIRGQRYMFSDVTRGMPLNLNFILVYKQFSASAPKQNHQKCDRNMVYDGEKNACKMSTLSNKKLLNWPVSVLLTKFSQIDLFPRAHVWMYKVSAGWKDTCAGHLVKGMKTFHESHTNKILIWIDSDWDKSMKRLSHIQENKNFKFYAITSKAWISSRNCFNSVFSKD